MTRSSHLIAPPSGRGPRLDKLWRLTLDFCVLLDTFYSDLDADKKPSKNAADVQVDVIPWPVQLRQIF